MQSLKIILLMLLVLVLPLSAECKLGEASHQLPAIVGQEGGLFAVTVKTIPGTGNVFLTAFPHTGVSTQISANDAVHYAFKSVNQNISDCDILVSIQAKDVAEYVDGPSAGLALSTLTYSVITGMPMRSDTTITGGVDSSGSIIRVGGLYEKARAAARSGLKYFITPVNTPQEKILLKRLESIYNISIIEVRDAASAVDFLFYDKKPANARANRQALVYPNVTDYAVSSAYEPFRGISKTMVSIESDAIASIVVTDNDTRDIKDQFKDEVKKQDYILDKGYLFTAANEAFTDYVGAATVAAAESTSPSLIEDKKTQISSCINSLPVIVKNSGNFDYAVGADLRKYWALNRISSIDFNSTDLAEERFYKYNQLLYADAWCKVSKVLGEEALKRNGKSYDESLLKPLALRKLQEAESRSTDVPDFKEKLQSAKALAEGGKYAASIYDSTYVIRMEDAESRLANTSQLQLLSDLTAMKNRSFKSTWAEVYHSHASFLLQDEIDNGNAYRIFYYAAGLENVTGDISDILNSGNSEKIPAVAAYQEKTDSEALTDLAILYTAVLLLIVVALVFFTVKSKGNRKILSSRKNKKTKKNLGA